ncbi:MAG: desulfoferrodoxin [Armatimonadota bacterium]
MAERYQVYKCTKCNTIYEVLHAGDGETLCCGEPLKLFKENSVDAAREKHVPVIDKVPGGIMVTVGSIPHPMEAQHYIAWIEVIADGKIYRQYLQPGDAPVATFPLEATTCIAREYCNLHGLWKGGSEV